MPDYPDADVSRLTEMMRDVFERRLLGYGDAARQLLGTGQVHLSPPPMTADDLRARPAYSDHGELPHVDVSPVERDALADLIESAEDAVRFEHSPSHMSALDDALAPFRREAKP